MKVHNIKKAIARMFRNLRWFLLVDHGESVDTIGQMLDRIDHLVLTHEDEIDALKMEIEELKQKLEAVDDKICEALHAFDFDDKIEERIESVMDSNDMGGRIESQIDRKIAEKFSTARIVFGDVEEPEQTEALLDEVAVHPFVDPAIDAVIAFKDSE